MRDRERESLDGRQRDYSLWLERTGPGTRNPADDWIVWRGPLGSLVARNGGGNAGVNTVGK